MLLEGSILSSFAGRLFQPLQPKVVSFGRLVEMVDQPIPPALNLVNLVETNSTGCFLRASTSLV